MKEMDNYLNDYLDGKINIKDLNNRCQKTIIVYKKALEKYFECQNIDTISRVRQKMHLKKYEE
ncbi:MULTISPECIES: hypothetical protein [Oceanotoga]|jgi:NADH:ubiquinone oxidoreductase subunit|uniref:Uncharacterized protein n=1 Tax=Oceanotoga teriensis TaxID=515440 RepID=A0AA45HJJ0_9BACT|nr:MULTISPECIES: hypothetical protein [Oceanotoga]MDN5343799.1 hypothetical protein [Oceanotoga sp.]MDO7975562.1 hypothetical protein [Oceanotoga teriensis]PWJ96149.1 hypothetical protein C7380_10258 [Oceanotoga teriensis]